MGGLIFIPFLNQRRQQEQVFKNTPLGRFVGVESQPFRERKMKHLLLAISFVITVPCLYPQHSADTSGVGPEVIIDAVVTRKETFVRDLAAKDFKLQVDGKKMPITSVKLQSTADSPERPDKHCLVLLFDSTTMDASNQMVFKQHVLRFIETAARSDHYVAILKWAVGMQTIQSFTSDPDKILNSISGILASAEISGVGTQPSISLSRGEISPDTVMRIMNLTQSLTALADSLGEIRGRKNVIFFTGGHPYSLDVTEHIYEAQDALNRANVAFHVVSSTRGWIDTIAKNTGGTSTWSTNSLPEALKRIAEEQDSYYLVTFSPPSQVEGHCSKVELKVTGKGLDVRARRQYCAAKPKDPLAGTKIESELEARVAGSTAESMTMAVQLPFFYKSINHAMVNVALDFLPTGMNFRKEKGKLVGELHLVGVATKDDGSRGPRFSDVIKLSFDKKEQADAFVKTAHHYETQIQAPPGHYNLRIALGSGAAFGRAEQMLEIEPWDLSKFGLSSLALGAVRRGISQSLVSGLDPVMLEGLQPLTASGVQVMPTGTTSFQATDSIGLYTELYVPASDANEATTSAYFQVRCLDQSSGSVKADTGEIAAEKNMTLGSLAIPVAMDIPIQQLGAGSYRLEIKAWMGSASAVRTVNFNIY